MTDKISDFTQRLDASAFNPSDFGGHRLREKRTDSEFVHGLAKAQQLVNRIKEGRATLRNFKEAMSTSDFPLLFATNLQRQVLGMYQETPVSWDLWAKKFTVNDFREVELFGLTGADDRLTKRKELTEAKQSGLGEKKYSVAVEIYERALGLGEEAIRNDDLNLFASIPARLGRGARRTEEYLATSMIADASGPHATFFSEDNGNLITRALSIQGLGEAYTAMATQTDSGDEPVYNEPAVLAVTPALKQTAQNILHTLQIESTQGKQVIKTTNQYTNLKLAVLYYAPTIMSSSNSTTSWFLFADPNLVEGAAVGMAHLRGMEEPGLYTKAPNAVSVNGGGYDLVDFDSNEMEWKVKHCVGATQLDPKFAVGSTGAVAAGA